MTDNRLPDSAELEERAYRCRTIARGVRHKETRQKLMRIADDYDTMARHLGNGGEFTRAGKQAIRSIRRAN